MFEWIEEFVAATGCSWETAAREYDYYHNPNYTADDYDAAERTEDDYDAAERTDNYEQF